MYHFVFFAFSGFIDFIVEPTFSLLTDSTEKIVIPLIEESSKSESSNYGASRYNLFCLFFNFDISMSFYPICIPFLKGRPAVLTIIIR